MKSAKITISALALCAVTLGLAAVSCSGGKEQNAAAAQQQVPKVKVETVEYSTSELNSSYPAIIKGRSDVDVRPMVSGFITKVYVDEGQRVARGQTLFTIDPVQYEAAVESARQQVVSAEAALASAMTNERNTRMLHDKNIISGSQHDMAVDNVNIARSAVAAAKAALASAQKNLSYCVVKAPANGVVGSIPGREGTLASPSGAPLTTISDINQVYAYFSLTEKDLLDLTGNGAKTLDAALAAMPDVHLRLANGEMYPLAGRVATVSGVIDNTTGAASVRALFDNTNGMLRSGSTGQVIIPVQTPNAIVIPQKATYELQDRRFVYLVNDSNMTVSAPIEVLDINDGQNYVVTSGLKPGDRIVVEGVGNTVRDNMKIDPVMVPNTGAMPAAIQTGATTPEEAEATVEAAKKAGEEGRAKEAATKAADKKDGKKKAEKAPAKAAAAAPKDSAAKAGK